MVYKTTTVEVDVSIDLEDFDTDDLIDELEDRGYDVTYNAEEQDISGAYNKEILDQIYHLRRQNKDYQSELDILIYNILGRIC